MALDVTADSNIYISALVFGGRPLQFLDAARAGVFSLAISDPIAEIDRVPGTKFHWPSDDLAVAAAELATFTSRVQPTETLDVVADDPDDNRVLECAVAAGSQYIVTGDGDLIRLTRFRGILILRVVEFLAIMDD